MISNNLCRPSFDRICAYVSELNFLGPVNRAVQRLLTPNSVKAGKMKKIREDVQAIVDHLKGKLGSTWQEASKDRAKKDSLLVNPPKSPKPWDSIMNAVNNGTFDGWVRSHIASKVKWM